MIQFMKNSDIYGEVKLAEKMPGLTVLPVGRHDFVNLKNPDPVDVELARNGWAKAREIIESGQYEIVILDEINVALACGLLEETAVIEYLKNRPRTVEVITTGCWAPAALMEIADLVTEMKNICHPYEQGIESREGIDH